MEDHGGGIELSRTDFDEDRYARLRLIPWWDQDRLRRARIMIVGAGALGNELIKDLALLGVGRLSIFDMDRIEDTNLTRSVLFRARDVGRFKAEVAAERAMELNPDVRAQAYVANIIDDVGLGFYRRADAVLGGLDNREARLEINKACFHVGTPWIDGAIEALSGVARVFVPGEGPCYECTMTDADWRLINKRKSCALLTHAQMESGKVPTTPTSGAVVAGVQVQELLKLLHSDRGLPTLAGKGFVFNGLTHDSYVAEYQRKPGCMSHDPWEGIVETPFSARGATLKACLARVKADLGPGASLEFDREIASVARCACGAQKALFTPVHRLSAETLACPACGAPMAFDSFHSVSGGEDFLDRTLFDCGLPLLHIVTGRLGVRERHYELSADAPEVLRADA